MGIDNFHFPLINSDLTKHGDFIVNELVNSKINWSFSERAETD